MTLAIVPVKRLSETKSRLFPELESKLEAEQREGFAIAMLQDVLAALLATPSLERVVVATPDEDVARAARAAGADALVRDDPGLNPALEAAAATLARAGEPLLVVLGDVAGALPADLEALFDELREMGGGGAVLAASSDGGTAALLRAPHDVIPSAFGADSAKRHRDAAGEREVELREVALPSLSIDLDVPEDIERFLQTEAGGANTRAALRALGWGSES